MKYLLFIILLMASLLTAGCVGGTQKTAVAPTPQIVYVTVFVTPTEAPVPQPTYYAEADCRRLDGYYNSNTGECHFPPPPQYYQPAPNQEYLVTPPPTIPIVFKDYDSYSQPQRTSPPSPTQTPNLYLNYLQNYPTVAPVIDQQTIQTPVPTTAQSIYEMPIYVPPTPVYSTGQPAPMQTLNTADILNCNSGYRRDPNTGNCIKEFSLTTVTISPVPIQTLNRFYPPPPTTATPYPTYTPIPVYLLPTPLPPMTYYYTPIPIYSTPP